MKIAFVGGGNMASALIGGLLKKGWSADAIHVLDIDAAARERLTRELGVHAHSEVREAVLGAACVVLAVKPQQTQAVSRSLAPHLDAALVITIAAGIRVNDLSRWLGGYSRIVRAMPNTPALVLAGVTGLYTGGDMSKSDRERAEQIMRVAGSVHWVEREEQLDAVTAVSGSGPAYVFYFIEALQQAAMELGFDADSARRMALETFSGAVKLAQDTAESVSTLRARVTSRGGTTERALAALEKDHVQESIRRAIHAAATRSRELGDALAKDELLPGKNPS